MGVVVLLNDRDFVGGWSKTFVNGWMMGMDFFATSSSTSAKRCELSEITGKHSANNSGG